MSNSGGGGSSCSLKVFRGGLYAVCDARLMHEGRQTRGGGGCQAAVVYGSMADVIGSSS